MVICKLLLLGLFVWGVGCTSESDETGFVKASPTPPPQHRPPDTGPAPIRPGEVEVEFPVPGRNPQAMTLFKPEKAADLHRALVLIHGGGWVSGSRQEMEPICRSFTKQGFTTATIDYTLAGPAQRWPAQLLDVQAAVRYIRAQAANLGIDPKHIGAGGVSAGGHLSMWLGVTDATVDGVSSRVQAVGSISGVLDLTKPMTPVGENYRIVQKLLSDDLNPSLVQKRDASPVFRLSKDSPPVFLIQGKSDPWVPPNQSRDTEARLKALGRPVQLVMVDGMGHGLDVAVPAQAKALASMSKWFRATLIPS